MSSMVFPLFLVISELAAIDRLTLSVAFERLNQLYHLALRLPGWKTSLGSWYQTDRSLTSSFVEIEASATAVDGRRL